MQLESIDPALQAANLALAGRRIERTTTRLASVQLRNLTGGSVPPEAPARSSQHHVAWEAGAMLAVGLLAFVVVIGVWML
jgi:hypothetical protein